MSLGRGIGELFDFLFWALALTVPLAIWKLIDIGIWLWQHIHVRFGS